MKRNPLVLGSSSKIRSEIISKYDYPYIRRNHKINEEEEKLLFDDPIKLNLHLATQKSLSLSNDFKDHIILGCDQICLLDREVFSKPNTVTNAVNNLKKLSGKTHQLVGSYVFTQNNSVLFSETVIVNMEMRTLTEDEIIDYVKLDNPLKSCGSYMFEKNGYKLFSMVDGSIEDINGLPFGNLLIKLKEYV